MAREDRRDAEALYNPMTVEVLQSTYNYNGHSWLNYFNSILPVESQLKSNDRIVVGAKSFFSELGNLLERTPKRVLANYVMWRQAVSSVSYLPSAFKQLQQEYNKATTGITVETPRWLECVDRSLVRYLLSELFELFKYLIIK